MFHALSWLLVALLLGLWSLAAWAFHATAAWTLANAGSIGGAGSVEAIGVPAWLSRWLPPEIADALASFGAAFQSMFGALLAWAPAAGDGLTVAVWVVWAVGAFLLVLCGLLASGLIAAVRRRTTRPGRLPPGAAGVH